MYINILAKKIRKGGIMKKMILVVLVVVFSMALMAVEISDHYQELIKFVKENTWEEDGTWTWEEIPRHYIEDEALMVVSFNEEENWISVIYGSGERCSLFDHGMDYLFDSNAGDFLVISPILMNDINLSSEPFVFCQNSFKKGIQLTIKMLFDLYFYPVGEEKGELMFGQLDLRGFEPFPDLKELIESKFLELTSEIFLIELEPFGYNYIITVWLRDTFDFSTCRIPVRLLFFEELVEYVQLDELKEKVKAKI